MTMTGCWAINYFNDIDSVFKILERKVDTFTSKYDILSEAEKEVFRADIESYIAWVEAMIDIQQEYGG